MTNRRIVKFVARPVFCGRIQPVAGPAPRGGECFPSLHVAASEAREGVTSAIALVSRLRPVDQLAAMSGKPVPVARRLLAAGVRNIDSAAFGFRVENERARRALHKAGAKPERYGMRLGTAHIEYL